MVLRFIAYPVLAVAALFALSLSLPVKTWRHGEISLPPLTYKLNEAAAAPTHRIWIDTDAACGEGRKTDADDCLAVLALARASGVHIAGISTVFGNAPRRVVDRTVAELTGRLAAGGGMPLAHFPGATARIAGRTANADTPASLALRRALGEGALCIVALGPLTNIAQALEARPDLRANVALLIAVMGRRPGHLFHPAEGVQARSWLGHGPMFRDFNVSMDTHAIARIVALQLPLVLVSYDAARSVEITAADLDLLERAGGAAAWAAQRSRGWLGYWTDDIGREGFFPFDLLAAGYAIERSAFECADVNAWVGPDELQYFPSLMPEALLVESAVKASRPARAVSAPARYCRPKASRFKKHLLDVLAVAHADAAAGGAPGARARMYRPPVALPAPDIAMYWHSRHEHSPAHRWIRSQVLDVLGGVLGRQLSR